jgi:RNA polymerase sigma-70 factor (ECF subfamily)
MGAHVVDRERWSDVELVRAAAAGDVAAFEVLYARYRAWAWRVALRYSGQEADAADVLQEAFAYVIRKLPTLQLTARFSTLLYPVLKHTALARKRKAAREVLQDDAGAGLVAVPDITPGETRAELAAALASLSAWHREVVLMRFVDEMSLGEIAAALEIPVGTVKSRLHHALEELRRDERLRAYFEA